MTEIGEVPRVTEDIDLEARVQGITRAIVITNDIESDEEQSHALVRELSVRLVGILHVQRPGPNRLWFISWLPDFIHNKFPDLTWFRRTNSLPVSTQQQAGPSGTEDFSGPSVIKHFTHAHHIVEMARDEFEALGPLLVIGSGRDTVSAASLIKKSAPTNVFVVQIQHPRCDFKMLDFVILPDYEYYLRSWFPRRWAKKPANNVHLTIGVMHREDRRALFNAAGAVNNQLGTWQPPLLVVNIGEPTKNCPYNEDVIRQLSRDLLRVYRSCGSIRIYISRTTPQKFFEILEHDFNDDEKLRIWTGPDPEQYKAYLHRASAIVVTADSVSMLSHACSTGKPVYVVGDECCTSWGLKEFLKQLMNQCAVQRFSQCQNVNILDTMDYQPLNDVSHAGEAMCRALKERRW